MDDNLPTDLFIEGKDVRILKAFALMFFISGCSQGITSEKIEQDKKWNAMMAEKSRIAKESFERTKAEYERKEKEAEKAELNRIAAIPVQRCYFSRDGRKVVDRLIDIVNVENITCQMDSHQPINTKINGRKTFFGNDQSGLLHLALVSDVTLCQAPWWKGGEFEYNECVASVAKGLRMWLVLTRDKSIPDDAFQYCPSYGSELDFASCAIYVWQYRKIK